MYVSYFSIKFGKKIQEGVNNFNIQYCFIINSTVIYFKIYINDLYTGYPLKLLFPTQDFCDISVFMNKKWVHLFLIVFISLCIISYFKYPLIFFSALLLQQTTLQWTFLFMSFCIHTRPPWQRFD